MKLEQEAFECLKKSLDSLVCIRPYRALKELLTRVDEDGRKYSRVYLTDGVTPLETVEDVIANLKFDDIEFVLPTSRVTRHVNDPISVTLVAKNIVVSINPSNPSDSVQFLRYKAGQFKLAFTMSYFNDNDKDLPLKLLYIGPGELEK